MRAVRNPLSLTTLRLTWIGYFIGFLLTFWISSLTLSAPVSQPGWAVGLLTLFVIGSAWRASRFRAKLLKRAARKAADGDPDSGARIWSFAHVLGFASAGGTALWGVLARFMLHSPPWVGMALCCPGGLLLLLYWPKPAPTAVTA
jgi:hypothetical protein